jgi:hypothetical protein
LYNTTLGDTYYKNHGWVNKKDYPKENNAFMNMYNYIPDGQLAKNGNQQIKNI